MADDRTPRTISLTEQAEDDAVPRSRKGDPDARRRRKKSDADTGSTSRPKETHKEDREYPVSRLI